MYFNFKILTPLYYKPNVNERFYIIILNRIYRINLPELLINYNILNKVVIIIGVLDKILLFLLLLFLKLLFLKLFLTRGVIVFIKLLIFY